MSKEIWQFEWLVFKCSFNLLTSLFQRIFAVMVERGVVFRCDRDYENSCTVAIDALNYYPEPTMLRRLLGDSAIGGYHSRFYSCSWNIIWQSVRNLAFSHIYGGTTVACPRTSKVPGDRNIFFLCRSNICISSLFLQEWYSVVHWYVTGDLPFNGNFVMKISLRDISSLHFYFFCRNIQPLNETSPLPSTASGKGVKAIHENQVN